ncbi:MAG: hypothetical protein MUF13_04975 [Akkermansiaceae bacterium]|nr:hypothetical protein [Akkermansiaceae bacterium]
MLAIACLGAGIAGIYGVIHDQITYTISEEYFTRLKFDQFRYADFGLHPRVFVAEIGFLATWWVGFFSAWFLARIAVPAWSRELAIKRCLAGILLILVCAFVAAWIGNGIGLHRPAEDVAWQEFCDPLGVEDVPAFVRVAYIHLAGYVGALIGLVGALGMILAQRRRLGGMENHG